MTTNARSEFRRIYRVYRLAHRLAFTEGGVAARVHSIRALRDFTDRWDLPDPVWRRDVRVKFYTPYAAFTRWLKKN